MVTGRTSCDAEKVVSAVRSTLGSVGEDSNGPLAPFLYQSRVHPGGIITLLGMQQHGKVFIIIIHQPTLVVSHLQSCVGLVNIQTCFSNLPWPQIWVGGNTHVSNHFTLLLVLQVSNRVQQFCDSGKFSLFWKKGQKEVRERIRIVESHQIR